MSHLAWEDPSFWSLWLGRWAALLIYLHTAQQIVPMIAMIFLVSFIVTIIFFKKKSSLCVILHMDGLDLTPYFKREM